MQADARALDTDRAPEIMSAEGGGEVENAASRAAPIVRDAFRRRQRRMRWWMR